MNRVCVFRSQKHTTAAKDYAIITVDGNLLGYLNEMKATVVGMERLRVLFAEANGSLEVFRK